MTNNTFKGSVGKIGKSLDTHLLQTIIPPSLQVQVSTLHNKQSSAVSLRSSVYRKAVGEEIQLGEPLGPQCSCPSLGREPALQD